MRRPAILPLITLVLLLGVSSSASAIRFRISDPDQGTSIQSSDLGSPFTLQWGSCDGNGFPSGFDLCAAFDNQTGVPITSLVFQFTANEFLAGAGPLECSGEEILTANNCPTGALTDGQLVTFRFFGDSPIPTGSAGPAVTFFTPALSSVFGVEIQADGLFDASQLPTITMTPYAAVPEPAELAIFGLGLVLIGLGIGARRRWQ